jgi:hypothetical protein
MDQSPEVVEARQLALACFGIINPRTLIYLGKVPDAALKNMLENLFSSRRKTTKDQESCDLMATDASNHSKKRPLQR